LDATAKLCCWAGDRLPYVVGGSGIDIDEAIEVCGEGAEAAPIANNAAWNDKSEDLFLSSRTTGLTGMAGFEAAEVADDVFTGLTETEFTGVCHGLALDLSLVALPEVEVGGENIGGCLGLALGTGVGVGPRPVGVGPRGAVGVGARWAAGSSVFFEPGSMKF